MEFLLEKVLISVGYGILMALSINVFQAFYLVVKIALNHPYLEFLKVFIFPVLLSIGVGAGFVDSFSSCN